MSASSRISILEGKKIEQREVFYIQLICCLLYLQVKDLVSCILKSGEG